jgi:hypothetical protein
VAKKRTATDPKQAQLVEVVRIPEVIRRRFEVYERRHAAAILKHDFPQEWEDLLHVLGTFSLPRSSIIKPGGNKSPIARALNGAFGKRGWTEKNFKVNIVVDDVPHPSPTHNVDYYKNRVAIETEWNNKDPFFDRDLNNFRLLHQIGVVSVGVIITRADELQEIFNSLGRGQSYGEATTHVGKLLPKIEGGGAGGCPLLVFGITKALYDPSR